MILFSKMFHANSLLYRFKIGICTNLSPGFECRCFEGYENVGNVCVDVDECNVVVANAVNPCGRGTCRNTDGSYHCECHHGFEVG